MHTLLDIEAVLQLTNLSEMPVQIYYINFMNLFIVCVKDYSNNNVKCCYVVAEKRVVGVHFRIACVVC